MTIKKMPSLNALRVFATVATVKSFKLAASELGVTQSAISRQIQTLEEQLSMRLIQRDNRVHSLTPAGELLAPELQRMFGQLAELIEKAISSEAADARLLKIGVSNELLRWWLAPRLDQFFSIYPHLNLEFVAIPEYSSHDASDGLKEQLTSDNLDAILILGGLGATRHIQSFSLADNIFYQVTSGEHNAKARYHVDCSSDKNEAPGPVISVSNTSMALDLMTLSGGHMQLPSPYLDGLRQQFGGRLTIQDSTGDRTSSSLQLHIARHKEHELAVVAFVNWLQHSAASDSDSL